MFKQISNFSLLLFVSVLLGAVTSSAAIIDGLTAAQKQELANRRLVAVTQNVQGYSWPKMWLYILVNSTPQEAAAVTFDYNAKAAYTPGVKKSHISKQLAPAVFDVDYTVEVPIISTEDFTLRNVMSAYDNGASFRLDFNLVRANHMKQSKGVNAFEAVGNQTIAALQAFIDPGMTGAGMIWPHMFDEYKGAMVAFRDQVEKEKAGNPQLLQQQLQNLHTALSMQRALYFR